MIENITTINNSLKTTINEDLFNSGNNCTIGKYINY